MSKHDELPIPAAAKQDQKSMEILRVWVANEEQHITLFNPWADPAAWGILLADLARNVADAYADQQKLDPVQTLLRIKSGLDAELELLGSEQTFDSVISPDC